MEWILELILIVLLAATLFHAVRLERALGVLGVVAAAERAFGGLVARGPDRLTHFGRHEPAEAVLAVFEDLGRPRDQRGPLAVRRAAIFEESCSRTRDGAVYLVRAIFLISP